MLALYGTKRLAEVLTPAIEYAERGFPMYEYMHRLLSITDTRTQFALYPPGGEAVFYPNGKVPPMNSLFQQPQLGSTLRLLVEAEQRAPGSRRPVSTQPGTCSIGARLRSASWPFRSGLAASCS